ncbi:MlaD family protein [Rhodopila sp.]|uniref:MlaD family protein n=1 Tax=Rhodopila sp. TaxID=2480087 RepID=UPI002CA24351|nr:MlaD family protein [Rhodopila sp.]HVZ08816.1 MlaD family protein [Rhodopila sp.]
MTLDRNTTVGAFVLGGVALAVAAAVMFGNFSLFSRSVAAVVVFQDSIAGLSVGAPVTFRGVPIGSVTGISIKYQPSTNTAYIPVRVRLEVARTIIANVGSPDAAFDVEDLVKRGLRAQLQTQSFVTGQAQIDLDFDPRSPEDMHPGIANLPEIPTRASAFQKAREQLQDLPLRELAGNANNALKALTELADGLEKTLPAVLESLKVTSDRSGDTMQAATGAIKTLQARLEPVLANLDSTLTKVNTLAVTGNQQLNQRGADLHTLLSNANQAVTQARDVLNEAKDFGSSRAATRQNVDSLLRDLAAAAASLRGFTADIEQNPQLLLTGRGTSK